MTVLDILKITEINFIIDLLLALICGFSIGLEREFKNKPAGISTQTTVITASMIFSFISSQIAKDDPSRIAAQIVSGVGFLGAGVILKSESSNTIINLTTASSIWYSACIGMALGFNFHYIALVGTAFIIIVNRIPKFKS